MPTRLCLNGVSKNFVMHLQGGAVLPVVAEVELAAEELDENGFIVDYRELKPLKEWIDNALDHRHLNEVFGHDMVTSERLAKEIYDFCKAHWPQTSAVRVSETPKTWAEYRP